MYAKEVNVQSPLRILEKSIHGGLGKGNLGVVMARAGVGKTASLIQIGLDDLMRGRPILHVALGQQLEHVQCWYDALFDDLAAQTRLEQRDEVAAMVARSRIIAAFPDHGLWPARLEKTVDLFRRHMDFRPAAILVDGFDWAAHSVAENAALIGAFKAHAKLIQAELWMTAQTHREATGGHPTQLTSPCDAYAELIDVALFLEPHGDVVSLRLLKDHDATPLPTHLLLHPDTLRLVVDQDDAERKQLPPSSYTLLSGGAVGAEAAFGECAEAWGLTELTFSFAGRKPQRTRGLVNLSDEELEQGAVSPVYIEAQMHRRFPNTPVFRKTLHSIWHQVTTAGEVFVIGSVQDDNTVKGGTGWAAELARHWNKPVHVFDQNRGVWLTWQVERWLEEPAPTITTSRFCGTGTRQLGGAGAKAIRELFERSFGPARAEIKQAG
jgi:hypothetical protein